MTQLKINHQAVEMTLERLHHSGSSGHEGIVLWLGERKKQQSIVTHVYEPLHTADKDFFHIPPEGMRALMDCLRDNDVSVLAQVHTHPEEAFHSRADDKWAIVRHVGAMSLVLPYFARGVTPANFISQMATFRLSQTNHWLEVPRREASSLIEVAA
jgi:proteasome lid subunit RPN8/RPN11